MQESQEGCIIGGMQESQEGCIIGGMQESQEGCIIGLMQESQEGCIIGGMEESQEGCIIGRMQERSNAGKEGYSSNSTGEMQVCGVMHHSMIREMQYSTVQEGCRTEQ